MLTLLMIQGVGVFGSLLFGWLGERITARRALLVALALWAGVALYAYFLTEPWEYFVLGAAVGLVLGGSQSLSRSLYSSMIPARASAEYFGYFSVLNKASSMLGPLVFAVARQVTGSSRSAVLFLLAFFVVGMTLLAGVRVRSGRPAGL